MVLEIEIPLQERQSTDKDKVSGENITGYCFMN